jgi:elongation factor G
MERGGPHGFPVVDLRAVCTGGKHHAVDSSEMAFKMAGSLALREAIAKVGTEVLEPVSVVTVHVPAEHHGDVLGDLNARRGQIIGTSTDDDGMTSIEAVVPTAEIVRYAIDLRSIGGGSGWFTADHHGYQPLPANLLGSLPPA